MSDKITSYGLQLSAAVEFLLCELTDGERASAETEQRCVASGICARTFTRARKLLGVIARMRDKKWYMALPEDAETLRCRVGSDKLRTTERTLEPPSVSTDWAAVSSVERGSITAERSGLHIKVGAFEFSADADYPTEKLPALLREPGGAAC